MQPQEDLRWRRDRRSKVRVQIGDSAQPWPALARAWCCALLYLSQSSAFREIRLRCGAHHALLQHLQYIQVLTTVCNLFKSPTQSQANSVPRKRLRITTKELAEFVVNDSKFLRRSDIGSVLIKPTCLSQLRAWNVMPSPSPLFSR